MAKPIICVDICKIARRRLLSSSVSCKLDLHVEHVCSWFSVQAVFYVGSAIVLVVGMALFCDLRWCVCLFMCFWFVVCLPIVAMRCRTATAEDLLRHPWILQLDGTENLIYSSSSSACALSSSSSNQPSLHPLTLISVPSHTKTKKLGFSAWLWFESVWRNGRVWLLMLFWGLLSRLYQRRWFRWR